jgi:uncharacterized membrane protein YdjX (TVP38/TMEM64 family)
MSRYLGGFGEHAELAFVGTATLAIALCAPASAVYILGGAIFGLVRGAQLGAVAALLASTLAFWIARSTFGAPAARFVAKRARLDRFERALTERPLWLLLLIRLSLLLPIGPVSYALGVTRVRFRYFVLSSPALLPTVVLYSYAGHIAESLLGRSGERATWEWVVLASGFVATLVVAVWIGRAAHRALGREPSAEAEKLASPRRDERDERDDLEAHTSVPHTARFARSARVCASRSD